MIYSFHGNESVRDGMHRILRELIERAVTALTNGDGLHKGVHEARRNLKMSRAVVRLLRYGIEEELYSETNAFLRDQGRRLSALRDLTAMLETLLQMEKSGLAEELKPVVSQYYKQIEMRREKRLEENLATIKEVARTLADYLLYIKKIKVCRISQPDLLRGLKRIYRQGRFDYRVVHLYPSEDWLHDWRKRAKYLRYHCRLLEEAWPAFFKTMEDELHRLTDALGDFNNLTVLHAYVSASDLPVSEVDRALLCRKIRKDQGLLLQKAYSLGGKLYAERPVEFARRTGVYLATIF